MIKTIIFDLNGVFIQSPFLSDRFQDKFGVSTKKFMPVLKQIMTKIRKPNAGDGYKYWKPYLKQWNVKLKRDEFFDFWFSAEKPVPELINYAKELKKKKVKLFILSNNFVERAQYYKDNFPFIDELFEKVYYSWQTGFIKPNVKAFKLLLNENDLKPEECWYFDNDKKNVKMAKGLGIKAFIFKDAIDLENKVSAYFYEKDTE